MKKIFFIFMVITGQLNAQTAKGIDSLITVKNFLLEVKKTVNVKQPEKQKMARLDSLIRSATKQKAIFGRNLDSIVQNKKESEEMKTSLSFILQSMVLYKADSKNNRTKPQHNEILYLNKNIPILINKIYFYCKRFQNFREEKTN